MGASPLNETFIGLGMVVYIGLRLVNGMDGRPLVPHIAVFYLVQDTNINTEFIGGPLCGPQTVRMTSYSDIIHRLCASIMLRARGMKERKRDKLTGTGPKGREGVRRRNKKADPLHPSLEGS